MEKIARIRTIALLGLTGGMLTVPAAAQNTNGLNSSSAASTVFNPNAGLPTPAASQTYRAVTPEPASSAPARSSSSSSKIDLQVAMKVSCIYNMENGGHVFQQGPRGTNVFILKDPSGDKLAVAYLSLSWIQRAQPAAGSSAYGTIKVVSDQLDYARGDVISGGVKSGHGKIDMCMQEDFKAAPDHAKCRPLSDIPFGVSPGTGDPERPIQVTDIDVSYTIDYDKKTIDVSSDKELVLSCAHPLYVPFLQGAPSAAAGANLTGGVIDRIKNFFKPKKKGFVDAQSPLVIDIDNTGKIDLTNVLKKEVYFDADGTGKKIRTGWIGPKAVFLVLDSSNDGRIASGRQLFGEFTDAAFDAERQTWFRRFYNGFQALAQYDQEQHGMIDASNPIWPKLRLWRDKNGDAQSTPDELTTLDQAGVESIDLAYEKTSHAEDYPEVEGNQIRFTSKATMKDGTKRLIGDVWFQYLRNVSAAPGKPSALQHAE